MDLISLKGVIKNYGGKGKPVEVLKGIDLSVGKGETIAVVGASGVGKSTLLNIMGALDRPTSGEGRFRGESMEALDDKRLAALRNRFIG
ncbi:MAG: ATP-binding cassette domain-containing protein, partial [Deltaproteobacteria bacterium]|nr:ATP-binding cassette domain-containing protein [Deltaproteobacteria bacterium]